MKPAQETWRIGGPCGFTRRTCCGEMKEFLYLQSFDPLWTNLSERVLHYTSVSRQHSYHSFRFEKSWGQDANITSRR